MTTTRRATFLGPLLLATMGAMEIKCAKSEVERISDSVSAACGNMRPYYQGCPRDKTCIEIVDVTRTAACDRLFNTDIDVYTAMTRLGCVNHLHFNGLFQTVCASSQVTSYIYGPVYVD